jgi:predicted transcriptional regulator
MMQVAEIADILSCNYFTGRELSKNTIQFGCASDLMSDVLAFSQSGAVLLTGLATIQTIQTADIADIKAVILVRGKKPDGSIIRLATEKGIPLLGTEYSMYEACGLLYGRGLKSTMVYKEKDETHA